MSPEDPAPRPAVPQARARRWHRGRQARAARPGSPRWRRADPPGGRARGRVAAAAGSPAELGAARFTLMQRRLRCCSCRRCGAARPRPPSRGSGRAGRARPQGLLRPPQVKLFTPSPLLPGRESDWSERGSLQGKS